MYLQSKKVIDAVLKVTFLQITLDICSNIIKYGFSIILIIIYVSGKIDLFDYILLEQYCVLLSNALQTIGHFIEERKKYVAALKTINRFNLPTETGNIKPDIAISLIEFRNVYFSYKTDIILNNFSYSFKHGFCYLIIGPNGVGKSTILDLLLGIRHPDNGDILFNQVSLDDLDKKYIRKKICYVAQQPILELSGSYQQLSGGELKYSSILEQLYKLNLSSEKILLLDEPTNDLDSQAVNLIKSFLQYVKSTCILIIISHDKRLLTIADNVITLERNN